MKAFPTTMERVRSAVAVGLVSASVLLGVVTFGREWFGLQDYVLDDAFITFRYARNLAQTGRLTFNLEGPPAEGYTSFLWTVLMAVGHLLGLEMVFFSRLLSVLALMACAGLGALWMRRLGAERPGLSILFATGLVLAQPVTALHLRSGMETVLAATCVLAVGVAASAQAAAQAGAQSRRTGTLLGLACLASGLVRPELNVLAACVAGAALAQSPNRRPLLVSLAVSWVLPGALYFAWRWTYYGLPLPLPFYVKMGLPHETYPTASPWNLLWAAGPVAFAVVAAGFKSRWRVFLGLGLGSAAVTWAIAQSSGVMGWGARYHYPLVPLVLAAATGLLSWARLRGLLFAGLMLLWAAWDWPDRFQPAHSRGLAYQEGMKRAHFQAAAWLQEQAQGRRLALGDAGAIPYYSGLETFDLYGLNDPGVARGGLRLAERLQRFDPDILGLVSVEAQNLQPGTDEDEQAFLWVRDDRRYQVVANFEFQRGYYLIFLAKQGAVRPFGAPPPEASAP